MHLSYHGYVIVCEGKRDKKHPFHRDVAEAALGKSLPKGACVHHVNEIKNDNTNSNLVICQDNAYHRLLHRRTNAYNATGNADAQKCNLCKEYILSDGPLIGSWDRGRAYHKSCGSLYKRKSISLRVMEDKCVYCGKPRGENGTSRMCRPCRDKDNLRYQRRQKARGV